VNRTLPGISAANILILSNVSADTINVDNPITRSIRPLFLALPVVLAVILLVSPEDRVGFRNHLVAASTLMAMSLPFTRGWSEQNKAAPFPLEGAPLQGGVLWEADPLTLRVSVVNGDTEGVLGYPVEHWMNGRHFLATHIVAEERERVLELYRSALESGQEEIRLEYRALNVRGEKVWVGNSMRVIRDAQGKPQRLLGWLTDVTEQKQMAEMLRQSQKMEAVGRLAGGVAHDFNNLLTVIGGYADMLLSSLDPADPRRHEVEEIKKAGERAGSLTRQLLTFSRQRPSSLELLDLRSAVGNLEKMLRRLIGEDVELLTASAPNLGLVRADLGRIEQVIVNLAVNARDAMPTGGRLIIETAEREIGEGQRIPAGRYVTLTFTDTGCGMDSETQRRVFEPFFTTKEPSKGTGLGLTTVSEIVRESGGHIEVESAVAAGTTFRIYLPHIASTGTASPVKQRYTRPLTGSETIIVVEDEETVRSMACHILAARGYRVLEAASGEEALRLIGGHGGAVDLLLTDVIMPHMSGRELAEQLVPRFPELRVLYMSGYTRDAISRHAGLDGETPYLQKPFTALTLSEAVRRVLDGAQNSDVGQDKQPARLV
jgi:two-component system, cell cycle sensor histidine kinase and response regulator CckA